MAPPPAAGAPPRRRTARPGRAPGELRTRDFLALLPGLTRPLLPEDLQDFVVRGPMFSLVGLHYGEPRVHYEVWVQRRAAVLELGLHFEAEAERNAAGLLALSEYADAIGGRLGPRVEGEEWTKSWTRIHETAALRPLTPDYAAAVAKRLAALVAVLEPLRRRAGV